MAGMGPEAKSDRDSLSKEQRRKDAEAELEHLRREKGLLEERKLELELELELEKIETEAEIIKLDNLEKEYLAAVAENDQEKQQALAKIVMEMEGDNV